MYLCHTYTDNIQVLMPHIHREHTCIYATHTQITYMNLCHTYTDNIHVLITENNNNTMRVVRPCKLFDHVIT